MNIIQLLRKLVAWLCSIIQFIKIYYYLHIELKQYSVQSNYFYKKKCDNDLLTVHYLFKSILMCEVHIYLFYSDGGQTQRALKQTFIKTGEEKDWFAGGELCCEAGMCLCFCIINMKSLAAHVLAIGCCGTYLLCRHKTKLHLKQSTLFWLF